MIKVPSVLLSVAYLLASDNHQTRLASAASTEKENVVKSILQRMESDALAFRDEIERVYSKRCETQTLTECARNNYNDCSSTYPNQQCMKADELVISACGDGTSCNALWDKTVSTVSIPTALADAPLDNPSDPEIIESACYSRLAEPYMIEKYQADEDYWAKYQVQPSWTYFGAHNGLFRQIPARHQVQCGQYDPRRRPWFVAASSGPKDVVLVIDVSGSMKDYGRLSIAKEAAITIVDTLTVADRVAVVSFSSNARQIGGYNTLIRATNDNKARIIQSIRNLNANGATNFFDAFDTSFEALDRTIRSESTSGCNIAVLFMTDGQISEGPGSNEVINLVNERTQQLATNFNRKTTIFTFSLGYQADHEVTKSIACSTNGIWTPVDDLTGDLVTAMSSYYKLFALGLGEGGNEDFAAWVEPYEFANPAGKMGTTVSVPVYDRSVSPPLFLGVVAVDSYMDALEQVLGEDAMSSTMLERFVMLSTARCPKIDLTECELDALRFLGGGKDATCGICNSTTYAGIVPEKCPFVSDLPNNLWHNTETNGKSYEDRACCKSGETVPSESCPAAAIRTASSGSKAKLSGGAIAGIIVGSLVLICGAHGCKNGVSKKKEAVPATNNNIVASYDGMSAVMPPSAPPLNPAYGGKKTTKSNPYLTITGLAKALMHLPDCPVWIHEKQLCKIIGVPTGTTFGQRHCLSCLLGHIYEKSQRGGKHHPLTGFLNMTDVHRISYQYFGMPENFSCGTLELVHGTRMSKPRWFRIGTPVTDIATQAQIVDKIAGETDNLRDFFELGVRQHDWYEYLESIAAANGVRDLLPRVESFKPKDLDRIDYYLRMVLAGSNKYGSLHWARSFPGRPSIWYPTHEQDSMPNSSKDETNTV